MSREQLTKKEWREKISALKSNLSEQEWREKSQDIHKLLFTQSLWHHSKHIALYHSVEKEVDTIAIIQRGWELGKCIYLPKCNAKEKQLIFYHVESLDQLEGVYYGIPEPVPARCQKLRPEELELVIVPGLAFDQRGYRIGYGGGFYDRFLSNISSQVNTLSLAFSFQVLQKEELPNDSFDIPVGTIVTDQETISCLDYRL
jgi:5-formyltetrahydrofolate cyclo-ligase